MNSALPNPLLSLHENAGAELIAYGNTPVVSTFGEPEAEYAAVRKGCALFDLPQRGILELTGKDRLAFLNNLLTNQTWNKQAKQGLEAGHGVYAFFLNGKGRIVIDMNVIERGDRTLLEMDGRLVESVQATFNKYLFSEQVTIAAGAGRLHQFAFHGTGAEAVLSQVLDVPIAHLGQLQSLSGRLLGRDATIWRDDATGAPGFHVILNMNEVTDLWKELLGKFAPIPNAGKRELRPAGWAVFNSTRIEAGRPLFGIDFDDSVLPAETGQMNRAVSFTKGCYLGQEIVARMHARGQLARQLVGIRMENDALPIAGTKIYDDGNNEIGGITSSTLSPILSNTAIALGYLKRPYFNIGTAVTIPAEGAMRKGTVVATPFVTDRP